MEHIELGKGTHEATNCVHTGYCQFLGYDPFPQPKTLPQHLFAKRRVMGRSIKDAAEVVGVDPGTWGNWELGKTILYRKHRILIARLQGLSADTLDLETATHWNRLHKLKH